VIISRTPFRVSLVGGGSDFGEYYRSSPGAVLTLAIDRYMYVTINKRFDHAIRVSYTQTEIVSRLKDLHHELIREAMRSTGVTRGVEITTIADLPAGIGLGSSSSLTVGVLNALHAYRGRRTTAAELADEACRIEIKILGKPIGKQDQYIAAFGGFQFIRFHANERVTVTPMSCDPETIRGLIGRLQLFYTGMHRESASVLKEAKQRMLRCAATKDALDKLVGLAGSLRDQIAANRLTSVGPTLHQGWFLKKEMASNVTNGLLDALYTRGIRAGAHGGKVTGAGGGGCLLFYTPRRAQAAVRRAMNARGLKEIPLGLEAAGTRIIYVGN
jgi:D-glycero-alpha-D-manno-heptose-7-phosphate kinase